MPDHGAEDLPDALPPFPGQIHEFLRPLSRQEQADLDDLGIGSAASI
jgi:hypothetical protein